MTINISYEQRKQDILPFIDQQENQVIDILGYRWIKCVKCGIVDISDNFSYYGGRGTINFGGCKKCF